MPSVGFGPGAPPLAAAMVKAPAIARATAATNRRRGVWRRKIQAKAVTTTGVRLVSTVALATEVMAMP